MSQIKAAYTVGIDISKHKLDVYHLPNHHHEVIGNDKVSIKQWMKSLPKEANVVLESTGNLGRLLMDLLDEKGFAICELNPKSVYHYRLSLNQGAKTDKIDARVLAQYGQANPELRYGLHPKHQRKLIDLQHGKAQLKASLTAEKNRLTCAYEPEVKQAFAKVINALEKQIQALEAKITVLILQDETLKQRYELLQTISGVGVAVAQSIVCALPELAELGFGQLKRLVGIAPMNHDSGMKYGKRSIMGGRQEVRNLLYMATLVATQHNRIIKQFYQRKVAEGKPKKVALVAAMAKMLNIMRAVVCKQQAFVDDLA